jgi:hypothetical protein
MLGAHKAATAAWRLQAVLHRAPRRIVLRVVRICIDVGYSLSLSWVTWPAVHVNRAAASQTRRKVGVRARRIVHCSQWCACCKSNRMIDRHQSFLVRRPRPCESGERARRRPARGRAPPPRRARRAPAWAPTPWHIARPRVARVFTLPRRAARACSGGRPRATAAGTGRSAIADRASDDGCSECCTRRRVSRAAFCRRARSLQPGAAGSLRIGAAQRRCLCAPVGLA